MSNVQTYIIGLRRLDKIYAQHLQILIFASTIFVLSLLMTCVNVQKYPLIFDSSTSHHMISRWTSFVLSGSYWYD